MKRKEIKKRILINFKVPSGYQLVLGNSAWIYALQSEREDWYSMLIPLKSIEGPWLDKGVRVYYNVRTGAIK